MTAQTSLPTTSATVNGARALSVRILTPWKGVWTADCDLDPEDPTIPTTGRVTITVGKLVTLQGTIDPRYSGRFGAAERVRVVGGAGGWDDPTTPNSWQNDAGVASTQVYASTAGSVGETVSDPSPTTFGPYFERAAGRASEVFGDRDWYVDPAGITQVGSRPVATPDPSLELLGYDANAARGEVSCDALVLPGTQITGDKRFDGTLTVRDVEQTFTGKGSRATVWFGQASVGRLASAMASMIREMSGSRWLKRYTYRFVNATGTGAAARLNLQLVAGDPTKPAGLPDIVAAPVFPGMAGLSAGLSPSQLVHVVFLEGDFKQPAVVGFDGSLPLTASLDAQNEVDLCASGGTLAPIARMGDAVAVYFPPSIPVTGTVSGAPFVGTMTILQAAPGVITAGSGKGRCG